MSEGIFTSIYQGNNSVLINGILIYSVATVILISGTVILVNRKEVGRI